MGLSCHLCCVPLLLTLVGIPGFAADPTIRPALSYSKTFGGDADAAMAVGTDAVGNVYVAGYAASADFPARNALQPHLGGTPLRVTTDSGKSWSAPEIAPGVNSIAASARPGILYAGTDSGIYRSVDSGRTWSLIQGAPKAAAGAVAVDSSGPESLYAATAQGVFRSGDGGESWSQSYSPPAGSSLQYPNLIVHPTRPATLVASLNYSLYRSTDAGRSWTSLGLPVQSISAAFDPTNPDILYVAAWTLGVYRSADGGDMWTKTADLPVTLSRNAIAAAPGAVFVATSKGLLRSTDGGASWTPTSITAPADVVEIDSADSKKVYAAADRIYASTDGGESWSPLVDVPRHSVATISAAASALFIGSLAPVNLFISKWSADGRENLYSTYLGGSYRDYATSLAVDRNGNVYVTGLTYSADFPVTAGALQTKLAGPYNAFVAKISADGSRLLYSTLLGGSGGDVGNGIAIDGTGSAYVTGFTDSADFPVTPGAPQSKLLEGCDGPSTQGDAFVAKLAADGGSLALSTYLGGSCADQGMGIAVDAAGGMYVAGVTNSPDFPVTRNAFTAKYGGTINSGFLAKLTPGGSLTYATFLGSGWGDEARAVTVDDRGNVYVAGSSFGLDAPGLAMGSAAYGVLGFPGTIGTGGPAFLLKLDASGAKVYEATLGACMTSAVSVAVDSAGRAWIAGAAGWPARSTGFLQHNCVGPTVSVLHPFQALELGWGFVAEFSADGSAVLFSSLVDAANALALDTQGNAVVAGVFHNFDLQRWPPALFKIEGSIPSAVTLEEPRSKAMQPHQAYIYPAVVAPGALVVLPGTELGPDQQASSAVSPGDTLPTTLAETKVTFDGIAAPLISVQSQQIVCLAPFGLAGRSVTTVQVARGENLSNAIRVPVASSASAILAVVNQDGTPNSEAHPAAPDSVITLHVAGMGPTDPPSQDGLINWVGGPVPKGPVQVLINAWLAGDILYLGSAPGQPTGITQINFRIPATIPGIGPWPTREYSILAGVGELYSVTGDFDSAPLWIH